MKSKLTLSISKDRIRRAKAYGAKRKKSVSQLFEEWVDSLGPPAQEKPKKLVSRLSKYKGILTGKITQKDMDKDPRLAHIFRKGL